MPEYRCVNIGAEGYPVWLILSEKATIVAIEPAKYLEAAAYGSSEQFVLKTVLTLVVDGSCVELKTPVSVESVCRILGFFWDQSPDVAINPETGKPEGGPQ